MWRRLALLTVTTAFICGCGGGSGGSDGNNGGGSASNPIQCTNGDGFSSFPDTVRVEDRGTVALGESVAIDEQVGADETRGAVAWAIDGVAAGDVINVTATTPNNSVDVTVSLLDLAACEYLVTDNLTPVRDSDSTLGYRAKEDDVLAVSIKWEEDSFEEIAAEIELQIDVQSGPPSHAFCQTQAETMTVGETVQGELKLSSDDDEGPLDNVYDVYAVELEAGQTVEPQLDPEEGIIMDSFIYNSDCIRMYPVPAYLLPSPDTESAPLTAPEAGTYRFYVSSYNGTVGTYDATLVEP